MWHTSDSLGAQNPVGGLVKTTRLCTVERIHIHTVCVFESDREIVELVTVLSLNNRGAAAQAKRGHWGLFSSSPRRLVQVMDQRLQYVVARKPTETEHTCERYSTLNRVPVSSPSQHVASPSFTIANALMLSQHVGFQD
jgi:hypothetical protein